MSRSGRIIWYLLVLIVIGVFDSLPRKAQGNGEWPQVIEPRSWTFPRDHGAHPEYRTEWWYFTGNLQDDSGARYGYQLTFFRQGMRKEVKHTGSTWSIRDLYFAHFTITDAKNGSFHVAERVSRAGPGLAGSETDNLQTWIFDWSALLRESVFFLDAKKADLTLKLELRPRKPLVFHGKEGLSKKGKGAGQASYYTSFTDLETRGGLKAHKNSPLIPVIGTSWFDHEFGSNQLDEKQAGWDWFSLHLSDGRDLMVYLLRRKDGSTEPSSSGTLVERDGVSLHLRLADVSVTILDHWQSPQSGGTYPSRWRMRVPSAGIDLVIEPLIADQELTTEESTGIVYWEGAVAGQGTSRDGTVSCEGYVELTGYAGSLGGIF